MKKIRNKEFGAVAVGKLNLEFFGNTDENLKTRALQQVCKDLRREENVSILSLGAWLEDPEKGELIFSAVAATPDQARAVVERVTKFIDENATGRIINDEIHVEDL